MAKQRAVPSKLIVYGNKVNHIYYFFRISMIHVEESYNITYLVHLKDRKVKRNIIIPNHTRYMIQDITIKDLGTTLWEEIMQNGIVEEIEYIEAEPEEIVTPPPAISQPPPPRHMAGPALPKSAAPVMPAPPAKRQSNEEEEFEPLEQRLAKLDQVKARASSIVQTRL